MIIGVAEGGSGGCGFGWRGAAAADHDHPYYANDSRSSFQFSDTGGVGMVAGDKHHQYGCRPADVSIAAEEVAAASHLAHNEAAAPEASATFSPSRIAVAEGSSPGDDAAVVVVDRDDVSDRRGGAGKTAESKSSSSSSRRRSSSSSAPKSSSPSPSSSAPSPSSPSKPTKKWTWKKPKGKPKRPLSAYNIFFQRERERLLRVQNDLAAANKLPPQPQRRRGSYSRQKIGFSDLAKTIAERWGDLDDTSRSAFESLALEDKRRYTDQLRRWEMEMDALGLPTRGGAAGRRGKKRKRLSSSGVSPSSLTTTSAKRAAAAATASVGSGGGGGGGGGGGAAFFGMEPLPVPAPPRALSLSPPPLQPSSGSAGCCSEAVAGGSGPFDPITSELVATNFAKLQRLYGQNAESVTADQPGLPRDWPLLIGGGSEEGPGTDGSPSSSSPARRQQEHQLQLQQQQQQEQQFQRHVPAVPLAPGSSTSMCHVPPHPSLSFLPEEEFRLLASAAPAPSLAQQAAAAACTATAPPSHAYPYAQGKDVSFGGSGSDSSSSTALCLDDATIEMLMTSVTALEEEHAAAVHHHHHHIQHGHGQYGQYGHHAQYGQYGQCYKGGHADAGTATMATKATGTSDIPRQLFTPHVA